MKNPWASRLQRIPPYLFAELDEMKAKARGGVIDLGEGNPDLPPPRPLLTAFQAALRQPENHRYPEYSGKPVFRRAVAAWYKRRFGVAVDPEQEVVALIGSKEGAGHFIWAVCDLGDRVAVCDPGYPAYLNQVRLCGATPVVIPLEEKNGFLPDLDFLARIAPGLKLLCLNFPNNPTTAVATIDFYQEVINLARKFDFYILNDNVYSEIYFDSPPPSILQIPEARARAVELHSLSKTFSIPGWRIGMAVGNHNLLRALLKVKMNTDSGPFGAVQDAAAFGLKNSQRLAVLVRNRYRQRRDVFCGLLAESFVHLKIPTATFYVWTKLPASWRIKLRGSTSYAFVVEMLKNCRVLAAPGVGFGSHGEGFVRFALIAEPAQLKTAAERINSWLRKIC